MASATCLLNGMGGRLEQTDAASVPSANGSLTDAGKRAEILSRSRFAPLFKTFVRPPVCHPSKLSPPILGIFPHQPPGNEEKDCPAEFSPIRACAATADTGKHGEKFRPQEWGETPPAKPSATKQPGSAKSPHKQKNHCF